MQRHTASEHDTTGDHYRHLLLMGGLSFMSMYALMYAMVYSLDSVYRNVNQLYMAGLMTAPMIAIELVVMRGMYHSRVRNAVILAASVIVGVALFASIRQQTGVSDQQFLRSMIPHHAGAILMCERAPLQDADIRTLCGRIIAGQREEIQQMEAKLRALQN